MPALVNVGHIYYLEDNYKEALKYYERAFKLDPGSPAILLSLAQTYNELENYKLVKQYYTKLKKVDSDLARRSAYLELGDNGTGRASARTNGKELLPWQE